MNKILFCILIVVVLVSCEYQVDGRIKNLTMDTLSVNLSVNLETKIRHYNYFDSLTYEGLIRKDGVTDLRTNWSREQYFRADFKILPFDSVWLFGGLAPGTSSKIYFDTIKIIHNKDTMILFDRSNIFNAFEQSGKSMYRIDIR